LAQAASGAQTMALAWLSCMPQVLVVLSTAGRWGPAAPCCQRTAAFNRCMTASQHGSAAVGHCVAVHPCLHLHPNTHEHTHAHTHTHLWATSLRPPIHPCTTNDHQQAPPTSPGCTATHLNTWTPEYLIRADGCCCPLSPPTHSTRCNNLGSSSPEQAALGALACHLNTWPGLPSERLDTWIPDYVICEHAHTETHSLKHLEPRPRHARTHACTGAWYFALGGGGRCLKPEDQRHPNVW
jgi:hypothetical protein